MQIFTIFGIMTLFIAALFIGICCSLVHQQRVDFSVFDTYDTGKPSILLDDAGHEWARFELDVRHPILLGDVPVHVIDAFLTAEDRDFFNHCGISFRGIARSIVVNIYHGKRLQGASTITQQLVKLLFLHGKKTFTRKIQEQAYAILLEWHYTKEQILQAYLNHVYFGCGIYGVEAASQRFWGKSIAHVTIDEAATLAAIVRSPNNYCPLVYPLSAKKQRDTVLHAMYTRGCIDQTAYEHARVQEMNIVPMPDIYAPHYKEWLRQMLERQFGRTLLYTGGLTIQTTLNREMQKKAEEQFCTHCAALKERLKQPVDGALITMTSDTRAIKALVGGYDFQASKFNRAINAKRQIGSIIKPLIYAIAMEDGMNFADVVTDEPIELVVEGKSWKPNNYDCQFNGSITLAYALSHSNNIATIKLLLQCGAQRVCDLARACGIRANFHTFPSLALGCIDATLFDVATMMSVFANDGMVSEPFAFSWVKDQWGVKIFHTKPVQKRVISSRIVGQVNQVLQLGIARVSRFFDDHVDAQAIGKTGTTNDWRICWFVGATPSYTTAVYIGCDDNRSMGKNVFPLRTALPIWLGFNASITHPHKQFTRDPSLREVTIDERTGYLVAARHPRAVMIVV